MKNLLFKHTTFIILAISINSNLVFSSNDKPITDILVEGNSRIESEAILNAISTQKHHVIDKQKIRKDLETLYDLGYFSKLNIFLESKDQHTTLIIQVVEKPAISAIQFKGITQLKTSDFKESMKSKPYSIVQEDKISQDIKMIEKKYNEKGFFLVQIDYKLEKINEKEVNLTFYIHENKKILVGDVYILGNHYISELELLEGLLSKPLTRGSAILSTSIFNENYVRRDAEFIAFYYRNFGFADVKVNKPIVQIDSDKSFARITFQIEEGIQYFLKSIKIQGDIGEDLYTEQELLALLQLKENDLFKYNWLQQDIETLINKYSDLGYAYVDINPITQFNQKTRELELLYSITKGKKVYFGEINIIGNNKTRDNVIRRELSIADGDLYSGTLLSQSKNNINRLGFFEEVQVQKDRSMETDLLDVTFKVKEKSTGHMQAALGFSPGGETQASWFGQVGYDENNQSGKGWTTSLNAKWAANNDYMFGINFSDPKVNDSPWSLGLGVSYEARLSRYSSGIEVPEKRTQVNLTVGRSLLEQVRGNITLTHRNINQQKKVTIFEGFNSGGIQNSLSLGLYRHNLNNYIDPSEGLSTSINHKFAGGFLRGDEKFMETTFDISYYYPIDFNDRFRTYFKLHGLLGLLWQWGQSEIPQAVRYRLGGYNDLRGYNYLDIGPKSKRADSPLSPYFDYNIGGDKQFVGQIEYYVPIIPQAGIKGLLFVDIGQVYRENEAVNFKELKSDFGFGFRWLTPMGPLRFEFAYPYDIKTQSVGDMQFIFTVGN